MARFRIQPSHTHVKTLLFGHIFGDINPYRLTHESPFNRFLVGTSASFVCNPAITPQSECVQKFTQMHSTHINIIFALCSVCLICVVFLCLSCEIFCCAQIVWVLVFFTDHCISKHMVRLRCKYVGNLLSAQNSKSQNIHKVFLLFSF